MSADLPKTYRFLSLFDLPDHQKSDAPQECSAESAAVLNAAIASLGVQPEGGAGKSIFLHAMLASLFCRYSPEEVRFVLMDLKGTESDIFSDLPHLARPVVRDAAEAVRVLGCAIAEMERRYSLMRQKAEQGIVVRNLDEYNLAVSEDERLPRIVIAADEYADILLCEKKGFVENVVTLARKARAAGIHLVFSTQRCSAEVLSGDLLANFPSRIALRVATEAESRRLLGQSGAQSLVCAGDMLLHTAEMLSCRRVQGVFIADRDVRTLVQEICALDDARPALSAFCS